MMSENNKIHLLVHELLPMYDELDGEVKRIVDEHSQQCKVCKEEIKIMSATFVENELFNRGYQEKNQMNEIKSPRPFKKLIQFKKVIFAVSFAIRVLLLVMILYFTNGYSPAQGALITADLILFYFPYVAIADAIHFIFFKNKYFWVLLVFDILMLLLFDNLLSALVL